MKPDTTTLVAGVAIVALGGLLILDRAGAITIDFGWLGAAIPGGVGGRPRMEARRRRRPGDARRAAGLPRARDLVDRLPRLAAGPGGRRGGAPVAPVPARRPGRARGRPARAGRAPVRRPLPRRLRNRPRRRRGAPVPVLEPSPRRRPRHGPDGGRRPRRPRPDPGPVSVAPGPQPRAGAGGA